MDFPQRGDVFLDKYDLEDVLGAGGFATVFLGIERTLGRRVAVKILRPDIDGYRGGIESRFNREVKVLASLSDPHTVTLLDWGRSPGGLLYMIFEYVHGEDLARLLERVERLDERVTTKILRQLLRSLAEAHRAGILHRDIKPENIRVYEYDGDPWRAKLLDFGIAKPVVDAAEITTKGALVGSPRYMSPEQLYDHNLTPASDIYSLGLVAFEMLMGRDALAPNSLAAQVLRLGEQARLEIPAEIASPRMRGVLERMLRRDPAQRYQSAEQVLAALEPTESASGPTVPRQPPEPTVQPRPRSNIPLIITLAAVLLAILAAASAVRVLVPRAPKEGPATSAARSENPLAVPAVVAQAPAPAPPSEPPAPEAPDAAPSTALAAASPGCGKAPPFAGDGKLQALDGFTSVSWHTYVPSGYDADTPHPVLFFFHEDAQTPSAGLDSTGLRKHANARGAIIIGIHDPALWSWRDLAAVQPARTALETTRETLCVDDARIFAFGHGNGGRAVERLPCVIDGLTAAAASAYRMRPEDEFCTDAPVPYLHIAPLADGYDPVEGGKTCGDEKISLSAMEALWQQRNGCGTRSHPAAAPRRKQCHAWDCTGAALVSCHVEGGGRWPGKASRTGDLQDCDGPPQHFPIADAVWDFFDSVSGPPPDRR